VNSTTEISAIVSESTSVVNALKGIFQSGSPVDGVLSVSSRSFSGDIAIVGGEIDGAVLADNADINGMDALTKLLQIRSCQMKFVDFDNATRTLKDQKLNIRIDTLVKIDARLTSTQRDELIRIAPLDTHVEAFDQFKRQLLGDQITNLSRAEEKELESQYLDMATETRWEDFVAAESPVFTTDMSEMILDARSADEPEDDGFPKLVRKSKTAGSVKWDLTKSHSAANARTENLMFSGAISWAALLTLAATAAYFGHASTIPSAAEAPYAERDLALVIHQGLRAPKLLDINKSSIKPVVFAASTGKQAPQKPDAARGNQRVNYLDPMVARLKESADLALRTGKADEAVKNYKQCLQIDPHCTQVRVMLIRLHLTKNQFSEARREIETGLKMAKSRNEFEAVSTLLQMLQGSDDKS
jgi:hypothetical protein